MCKMAMSDALICKRQQILNHLLHMQLYMLCTEPRLPGPLQVTACTAGQTYAINVYSGSNIESQVIFSISTGCWAACAGNTTLSSISAVTGADSSGDTAYASQAGIPLPSNYTPVAAVAEDPMNTNPCLGQDAGYYNGMTSTFFGDVYPADSTSKDDFPLDFSGAGNFTRYSNLQVYCKL